MKRNWMLVLNICGFLSLLAVGIVFGVRNDGSEKLIAELNQELLTFKSANSAPAASVNNTEAISLLYQDNSVTKQNAEVKNTIRQLREFESPAALMAWAKEHLTHLWIVNNQVADCDDYASRLQLEAFKDGYLLSVQIIRDGMLNGKNVSNFLESHMGNLAMIGNEIYFIEPQPEYFRIVFVCDRD